MKTHMESPSSKVKPPKPLKKSAEKKSLPNFTAQELEDIITYHTFYKKYFQQLNELILRDLIDHPFWGAIIQNIPKEALEAQNKLSIELQDDAIYNGNWNPYVKHTTDQGIIALLRNHLIPIIKEKLQNNMEKAITIIKGMDLFIDFAMTIVGESYINEMKKLVESQKLTVIAEKSATRYARSLIEASLDPLVTISLEGKITDVNEASVKVIGMPKQKLIGTNFSDYFTEPEKANEIYEQVFEKGLVADYPLTIKHLNGNLTDVLYNASVYKDEKDMIVGVVATARDITTQKELAEREVAEREKELKRIEELERFRKLTVGRELKMIELKTQIEDLNNQLAEKK